MAKKDEKTETPAETAPDPKSNKKDAKDKKAAPPKKEEEVKEEPKVEAPKAEEAPKVDPPKKRAPIDKQSAYLEFKDGPGKKIEETILSFRSDVKDKRITSKDLTEKINLGKRLIDKLKSQLDKKEEERRVD